MRLISCEKNKQKNNSGFGILEVVIAAGIVASTFVVLMSLFAYNIRVEIQNRNKIVASYLAQEAIEVLKQKRDTDWFSSLAWDQNICNPGNLCDGSDLILDVQSKDDLTQGWNVAKGNVNKQKMFLYNGNYIQSNSALPGATDSGFSRKININKISATEMQITVDVTYNAGVNHVRVISYLYSWQ